MATLPIKDEDFQISISKNPATQNASKVHLTKSIASIFKDSKIVAMQCNQPVYNIPAISGS